MFQQLFNEDGAWVSKDTSSNHPAYGEHIPAGPRLPCKLAGIENQGATCYLNSLLQTLVMTPEFRESLFKLGPDELGSLENKDRQGAKVRVIPIRLQQLFTRLLLLDAQAASTTELTDSFGWTNSEELTQHDVQELNRILFTAVEDSLVGTPGQDIINNLYHGTLVNQIICEVCSRVSEREEDFLDLCVSVSGSEGLEQSLSASYEQHEMLDGNNQYKCEACQKLVNARKGVKVRHLPPLLTISLLRFSFDYQKLERYKETGKFTFPEKVDMGPYVENLSTAGNTEYELFSVVIHSGGAHGGHYTAYIRDIDSLGHWKHPDDEEIMLAPDPKAGRLDVIECDSPLNLILTILGKTQDKKMSMDKLCMEITQCTGVSWNKRFKKQYGPINKFLKKHEDKFVITDTNDVLIQDQPLTNLGFGDTIENTPPPSEQSTETKTTSKNVRPRSPPPEDGKCWFFYNDSRIHPVRAKELENQFSGKSCAYMLFYRRADLLRPAEAKGRPDYCVPPELVQQIVEQNESLCGMRKEYHSKMNTIVIRLLFPQFLTYRHGAIQTRDDSLSYLELAIDQRKTVREIIAQVEETYGELMPVHSVVHFAKRLAAGIHPYHCISDQASEIALHTAITDKCRLLVWDGIRIDGEEIATGAHREPIQLYIRYGDSEKLTHAFCKLITVMDLRQMVSGMVGYGVESSVMSRVISSGDDTSLRKILPEDDGRTLVEMNFKDGETLLIEHTSRPSSRALVETIVEKDTAEDNLSYVIENRCVEAVGGECPLICVTVPKDATVAELKATLLSQICDGSMDDTPCRLRPEDNCFGLQSPVSESMELRRADFKPNSRIVLEPGLAPDTDQFYMTFSPDPSSENMELIVSGSISVRDLVNRMIEKAGKQESEWHVCRTNWCGEATNVLDDLELTLIQCQLRHGDHLLLLPGCLPPKGHLQLTVELHPYFAADKKQASILKNMGHVCPEGIKAVMSTKFPTANNGVSLALGSIVISKDSTLNELKSQILDFPDLLNLSISSNDFLRLRLVEQKVLTTVLKEPTQTLQKLKLTGGMTLGVQILPRGEILNNFEMLLNLRVRIPGTVTYNPVVEMIWDTSQGPTPGNLRQSIANFLALPVERLMIAKHMPSKFEWVPIVETSKVGKQSGKKKGKVKVNLKNTPYHMKDGDVIGAKNLEFDPLNEDEFTTRADLEGRERIRREIEERRQRREEMRIENDKMNYIGPVLRKEASIKIHVDDFR